MSERGFYFGHYIFPREFEPQWFCFVFWVLLIRIPVLSDRFFQSKDELSELEQLEIIVATQDLLLSESVDISKYLEDEGREILRFEKPATDERIRQRKRNRTTKKTRQNTAWAVNVCRAWAEHRNSQIGTLGD